VKEETPPDLSPRAIRLTIEYDGTAYNGWQTQPNGTTIQQLLEEKLFAFTREEIRVTGAGRTDAGVHALGQVASFATSSGRTPDDFRYRLNALLPPDIAVREATEVDAGFDARRSARGKLYRYRIWNSGVRCAFEGRYAWLLRPALDLEAMRRAAAMLLGEHDFSAFRAADCQAPNPVRVLRRLDIDVDRVRPELCVVHAEATAFLKHMVRNLVGTLVQVGLGKRPAEDVAEVLASRDRRRAGPTAPPHGLFLVEVYYP
jgi:tRNA pseudouridine38-40 synthase